MASFNQVPSGQATYTSATLPNPLYTSEGNAGSGNVGPQWLVHNFQGENNTSYTLAGLNTPLYTSTVNATNVVIKDIVLYYQEITSYPLTGQRWPKRI